MLILALVLQSSVAIPLTGEMLLRSELGDSIHGAAHPAAKTDSASAGQHNPPKELVANAVAQNSDSTLAPSTPKNCVVLKSYMQMTVALSCSDGHDNASCFDASGKQTIQTHSDAILDHLRLAAQSEELPQTRFTLSSSVSDGHVLDVRMEFTGAAAMKFGRDLVQHLRGTAFDWLPPRSSLSHLLFGDDIDCKHPAPRRCDAEDYECKQSTNPLATATPLPTAHSAEHCSIASSVLHIGFKVQGQAAIDAEAKFLDSIKTLAQGAGLSFAHNVAESAAAASPMVDLVTSASADGTFQVALTFHGASTAALGHSLKNTLAQSLGSLSGHHLVSMRIDDKFQCSRPTASTPDAIATAFAAADADAIAAATAADAALISHAAEAEAAAATAGAAAKVGVAQADAIERAVAHAAADGTHAPSADAEGVHPAGAVERKAAQPWEAEQTFAHDDTDSFGDATTDDPEPMNKPLPDDTDHFFDAAK